MAAPKVGTKRKSTEQEKAVKKSAKKAGDKKRNIKAIAKA